MSGGGEVRRPRPLGALWASTPDDPPWDVVVVGSGYGGAAAAAAWAGREVPDPQAPGGRRRVRLLVLERGRAWQPGDFPRTLAELPGHLRLADSAEGQVGGQEEGLFDLRPGPDVVALVANGVGGGSLINAGVLLEPEPAELTRPDFAALVRQLRADGHFDQARRVLGGTRRHAGGESLNTIAVHPRHRQHPLRKSVALHRLAHAARDPATGTTADASPDGTPDATPGAAAPALELPITVALEPTIGPTGQAHAACTLCGDCMTGCNVGAKRSLDTTLLAQAMALGAQVVTGATVTALRKDDAGAEAGDGAGTSCAPWLIEVRHTRRDLQARETGPLKLQAQRVVLAAGTLGSTEILLRSRHGGLALSPRLGERLSCNGDNLAAVHRMALPVQGVADEAQPLDAREVGPTITTGVHLHPQGAGARPFWLQEFAVPAALRWLFEETVTTGHALGQLATADPSRHGRESPTRPDPAAVDPAAMARTLLVGLIGHDDAQGVLALPRPMASPTPPQPGTLRIHWPQARQGAALTAAADHLDRLVQTLRAPGPDARPRHASGSAAHGDGPHLVLNPLWRPLPPAVAAATGTPAGPVLTVHPLGGCPIGPDADHGVVDDCGRVYDAEDPSRRACHPGLVVLDGAIVPESLGANPSLTITALALRAASQLAADWGFGEPPAADRPSTTTAGGAPSAPPPGQTPSSASRQPDPPRPPQPTVIAITERLTGPIHDDAALTAAATAAAAGSALDHPSATPSRPPSRWVMELTLAYRPLPLAALTRTLGRTLEVDPQSPWSRVRLYDADTWEGHGLAGLDDGDRAAHAVFDAAVEGTLDVLHREASGPLTRRLRALAAWQRHRLWRDLWQAATEASHATAGTGLARAREAWALASRAGEVRRFDYRLRVGAVRVDRLGLATQGAEADQDAKAAKAAEATEAAEATKSPGAWAPGAVIEGCKRLTYATRRSGGWLPVAGNPWRQLTELHLTRLPGSDPPGSAGPPQDGARPRRRSGPASPTLGTLVLDARFLARRQAPLLRIVGQDNQVQALADLASLGLMLLRMVVGIHLWTFRLPDRPAAPSEPVRLPQPIAGLPPPEVTELVVDHDPTDGSPVVVRLTRYPQPATVTGPPPAVSAASAASAPTQRPPALVMIHGYSVSGNTFTHASLKPSAAAWFHARGHDVWVVDLRTSTGLPTATRPWTMEQVAWIDIPAALLHVRQATGGPVDVLAHCIGCVMLSMALLARPGELDAEAAAFERAPPLNGAQRARLADFHAAAAPGRPHPTVRRLVLSQKGPVLRYTDANVLRGWLMQFLRRWLLPAGLQFKPSTQPGVGEQLLDRLLASLPYPDADWAVENPWQPWRRTEWTATRHRMDLLYGRDFEAANLSPPTLQAIDDLFGPMNLDTLAQTLHFTRLDMATDATGQGLVTAARLRERWAGIPTLALHGAANGLVDAWTQRLLAAWLLPAGVPLTCRTYDGIGHQDLLIGRDSARVFADVEDFLRAPAPAATLEGAGPADDLTGNPNRDPNRDPSGDPAGDPAGTPATLVFTTPWLGPRIDIEHGRTVRVAAMPGPASGPGRLVLLPVQSGPDGRLTLDLDTPLAPAIDAPTAPRHWQFAYPGPSREPEGAWLAVIVHHPSQAGPAGWVASPDFAWPGLQGEPPSRSTHPALRPLPAGDDLPPIPTCLRDAPAWQTAAQRWLADHPPVSLIPAQALARTEGHLVDPAPAVLRIAVASCQYPHGPLDAEPAQAALHALADRAATGAIDLVLFVGDQIYADATAGLVDPTSRDERYVQPYERALGAAGMRRVLAQVPAFMVPDDHELVDNWEPRPAHGGSDDALWALREASARDGRWAYWRHARLRPKPREGRRPGPPGETPPTADKAFVFGGVPCFVLDTRMGRSARRGSAADGGGAPTLIGLRTWRRLQAWLLRHRDAFKIVACPALLLPRRREVVDDPANAARCDAWDGFPASRERLLDFLARHRIGRTVFVSGDEHHSMACEITLQPPGGGPAVTALSVHSSALYAPYPFANGRRDDLSDAGFTTAGGTEVTLQTTFAPAGDGWAILQWPAGGDRLTVTWVRCDAPAHEAPFVL